MSKLESQRTQSFFPFKIMLDHRSGLKDGTLSDIYSAERHVAEYIQIYYFDAEIIWFDISSDCRKVEIK